MSDTPLIARTQGDIANRGPLGRWNARIGGLPSYRAPGQSPASMPIADGPLDRVGMNHLESPEQPVPLRGITHWPLPSEAEPAPSATTSSPQWRVEISGTGILLTKGDVLYEPQTWVLWAAITGREAWADEFRPPITETDNCVWLECLNVQGSEAVVIVVGPETGTAGACMRTPFLTTGEPSEADQKVLKPICRTEWVGGVLSSVEPMQCGIAIVTRSA